VRENNNIVQERGHNSKKYVTKIEFPVVVFSAILKIPQIHVYCAGLFAI
jgi:hypothetical protein